MESLGDILKRLMTDTRRRTEEWRMTGDSSSRSILTGQIPELDRPSCQHCDGTGWVSYRIAVGQYDYRQCECRRDLAAEDKHRWVYANLPNQETPRTFDTFEAERDSQEALEAAISFAQCETGHHVLTLFGTNGNGKSHLVEAIAREMLAQGRWVKYAFAPDLLDALRNSYDPDATARFEQVYELYSLPDVLLLDDLGAERSTEWAVEKLTRLVDDRLRSGKRLVVATNLNMEGMAGKLSPRLADRLFDTMTGMARPVYFPGKSHRTGRFWKLPWH